MCLAVSAFADEGYFNSSSENGLTGIFESPTARIMSEDYFRMGLFQTKPYRNYALAVSLYDRIELSGRFTEIIGVDMGQFNEDYWGGYGNYKDKFVAAKIRLRKESKYLPELSLGLNDPHGTKLFGAQYFALSKQIYPFDFTFGMGLGRFGEIPFSNYGKKDIIENYLNPKEFNDNGNPFFSVNFRPSKKWSLLYELSPVDYDKNPQDPAIQSHLIKGKSKNNFGARYYLSDNLYLTASYQRGDTVGLGITMPFKMGKPVVPIYQPKFKFTPDMDSDTDFTKIYKIMSSKGFTRIKIDIKDNKALISCDNGAFFYEKDAIGYLAESLDTAKMKTVNEFEIIVNDGSVQLYTFKLSSDLNNLYKEEKITLDNLYAHAKINREYRKTDELKETATYNIVKGYAGYKPQINFFLNDPSGFFKGSYGVKGWTGYNINDSLSVTAGIAYYPFNDISTINEKSDEAIRSDVSEFIDKKLLLDMMLADYKGRIPNSRIYYDFEGGILETQFAGITGEVAVPFLNNNLLLGVSYAVAKKRDTQDYFGINNEKTYDTAFLKSRIHFRRIGTYFDIDAGQFLGGDRGVKVKITKEINGVELSAWYTKTNTSVFHEEYNKGYSDKGVMVTVPFRLFKGQETRSSYSQSISPWTRDTGAQIGESTNIFDIIDRRYK